MVKKVKISQEDMDTFLKAVEGVKPLIQKKIRLRQTAPNRNPVRQKDYHQPEVTLTEVQDIDHVQGEEFISFKQTGISNKTLRKLRKGQYNVEAILDLHGQSVEKAKTAVESFIKQCLQAEIRVALIIHGKGHHSQMPILKNKLNHWLREINVVLAFCSAAPSHGSRGAIYVLLKSNTEENSA